MPKISSTVDERAEGRAGKASAADVRLGQARKARKEMPPGGAKPKGKHLTQEERTELQDCLYHGMRFKAIGKRWAKDPMTIRKAVKRNIIVLPPKTAEALPCPQRLRAPLCLQRLPEKKTVSLGAAHALRPGGPKRVQT